MRILKVQPQAEGRSYKIVNAMRSISDIEFEIAIYDSSSGGMYANEFIPIGPSQSEGNELRKYIDILVWPWNGNLAKKIVALAEKVGADIIHTNGSPDFFGAACKKYGNLPVVHEIYDTYSLYDHAGMIETAPSQIRNPAKLAFWDYYRRKRLEWEKLVHRECDALIFTSKEMMEYSVNRYGKIQSIIIPNGVLRQCLPERRKSKLSQNDKKIHCVYLGKISANRSHRMIIPHIRSLASCEEIVLHIYPLSDIAREGKMLRDTMNDFENIFICNPLHYLELYEEITQYDIGLVLLNPVNEALLDVALPNKIFEYVAAGLPVAVPPYKSLENFVLTYGCGFTVTDWSKDIINNANHIEEVPFKEEFAIDHYMPLLLDLYNRLI